MQHMDNFERRLAELINQFSLENDSNTQDFILAKYMQDCLNAFNHATTWRERLREKDSKTPKQVMESK